VKSRRGRKPSSGDSSRRRGRDADCRRGRGPCAAPSVRRNGCGRRCRRRPARSRPGSWPTSPSDSHRRARGSEPSPPSTKLRLPPPKYEVRIMPALENGLSTGRRSRSTPKFSAGEYALAFRVHVEQADIPVADTADETRARQHGHGREIGRETDAARVEDARRPPSRSRRCRCPPGRSGDAPDRRAGSGRG
jgi:hypothetical protein